MNGQNPAVLYTAVLHVLCGVLMYIRAHVELCCQFCVYSAVVGWCCDVIGGGNTFLGPTTPRTYLPVPFGKEELNH